METLLENVIWSESGKDWALELKRFVHVIAHVTLDVISTMQQYSIYIDLISVFS